MCNIMSNVIKHKERFQRTHCFQHSSQNKNGIYKYSECKGKIRYESECTQLQWKIDADTVNKKYTQPIVSHVKFTWKYFAWFLSEASCEIQRKLTWNSREDFHVNFTWNSCEGSHDFHTILTWNPFHVKFQTILKQP